MLSTGPPFGPERPRVKTIQFLLLSSLLLLGACSSIEHGTVVGKGHHENSAVNPPIDFYWVEVSGKDRDGQPATERVQLFQRDWDRYKKGDRISPHEYDMIGATKALKASVKKLAKIGRAPTPETATPKPAQADRKATPKKVSPPPAIATPRPRVAAESAASREAKFRNVETRANEDPTVRDLKLRIHGARTDEEQTAAFQEFRRALFQKMRDLDPSLKDRIDRAENAAPAAR